MDRMVEVDAQQLLRLAPATTVSFKLPVVINERLDELVAQAQRAGERTDRREVLSALLLSASMSADDLQDVLRIFRTSTNGEGRLRAVSPTASTFTVPAYGPGPRKRNH
jgi:hypothetical protein